MGRPGPPPFYRSPAQSLSFLATLKHVLSDPAAVIPSAIYDEWALKLPGPGFPVVVAHPESVRDVLVDKGDTFGRDRQLRRLMRRVWGEGLAGAEGEAWARQRRAASPAFRPQAVEAVTPVMAAAARDISARWRREQPIELAGELARMITQVVIESLLSGLQDLDYDRVAADIPKVVREVTTFDLLDAAPLPDRVVNRWRGLGQSQEEARLRGLAVALAAARAAPPDRKQDIPALLRGVGPVADNAFGFMLAGFETTALGAAWAVYLLALHPEWQEAVRAEAGAADEGSKALPLARQVAQEALRLYPPAPILVRAALRKTRLQGYRLWPKQAVLIPVYAIHRHRRLWERPDDFDPHRFGPSGSYERSAYLPFGAGPRLCIAANFALTEISVILSELIRSFRFSPSAPSPDVSLKVSTHSSNGIHVIAEPV